MEYRPFEYRPLLDATNAELADHYRYFMELAPHERNDQDFNSLTFGDVLDEVFAREIMLNELEEM